MNKVNRKKLIAIISAFLLVSIAIFLIVFLIFYDKETVKETEERWNSVPFDPNYMPTSEQMNEIMGKAEDAIYPKGYRDSDTLGSQDVFIPNTNISFPPLDMYDSISTMAFTLMAFKSNPYAATDKLPFSIIKEAGDKIGGSEKTLPDGTRINLATLEEKYTELQFKFSRGDLRIVNIEGKRNGNHFEEEVDLSPVYKEFYSK